MLFTPGDSAGLVAAVHTVLEDNTTLLRMRKAARAEFEQKFTAGANYKLLMAAYGLVLGSEFSDASDRADCATENARADTAAAENLVASSL
jgi:hypothetical protein